MAAMAKTGGSAARERVPAEPAGQASRAPGRAAAPRVPAQAPRAQTRRPAVDIDALNAHWRTAFNAAEDALAAAKDAGATIRLEPHELDLGR